MLYISIFDAKEEVSIDEINEEREEWYSKGRDKTFHKMCKRINDPHALNMLSHHFGDRWLSVTYPILEREMYEAMEEDRTIIGG
jgi:hypothetical protein